jgi:5-methylcytosine-specific restriction endonuclease McrA
MRALLKPEPRKRTQAREKRHAARERKEARRLVFLRANDCCERCAVYVSDDVSECHPMRAHVNEKLPKSRGGSATDLDNLELLCRLCHLPNGQHAPTAARQAFIQKGLKDGNGNGV